MRVLPISSHDDIPGDHAIIGSAISGGSFREYLKTMMEQHQGKVCLYLYPRTCRFVLPCYDGQGEDIELEDSSDSHYTDILCCNWIFRPQPPTVILFDNDKSLRRKYEIAEESGIPLLIAESDILNKIKTP